MRRRGLSIALLVFEALWLNVIVPGHTRGIVPLPGSACPRCQAKLALAGHDGLGTSRQHPDDQKPCGDPAGNCAICHFAVRLTLPPVIDLTPPRLQLIATCPVARAVAPCSLHPKLTYHGRAPPAMA
jgi:hypothetical protein